MIGTLRRLLADALLERPRYRRCLRDGDWVSLRNRHERLETRQDQRGVVVAQKWTSNLFLPERDASLAASVFRSAFSEWKIQSQDGDPPHGEPRVSFLVGHRGVARLPLVLQCLASLAGQSIPIEVIVIEQDSEPHLGEFLPTWVRHVFQKAPPELPYCRSWAFNRGVLEARSPIVVCHDGDLLAPVGYAMELATLRERGWQAMRLARFVFQLSQSDSRVFPEAPSYPIAIMQNFQGGTIAVDRQAYLDLGGHDEAFVGWGGEDNEFFERLRTVRLHEASYLPFVHLWHPTASAGPEAKANLGVYAQRAAVPVADRIRELATRPIGEPAGPWPLLQTKAGG